MTNQQLAVFIQLYRRLLARCILKVEERTPGKSFTDILGHKATTWPEFKPLWDLVRLMDDDTDTLETERIE